MKLLRNILLVCLSLCCLPVFAQEREEDAGGSPYSLFGIGDQFYFSSNRTYSMGIVGTSLFGNYINTFSPASLAKLRYTDINLSFNYGFLKSANAATSNEFSNGNVLGFNIAIPFSQGNGWVLGLGFNPVTIVNTKVKIRGTSGTQSYVQTYSSKGGLSRINAAMSYTLLQKVTFGLEYNYGFGEIKSQNFIDFGSSSFTNTNIRKELDFDKSYIKAGVIIEPGKIFRSFSARDLAIGFNYQSGFDLNSSEQGIYTSSISVDSVDLGNGIISIPEMFSFGISNIFANRYLISADLIMQDWSNFGSLGIANSTPGSSYRVGLGVELLPDRDANTFLTRMTYRLGGFYDKAFYNINGEDISSWGIRAGLNIPISPYNTIDLGINYSQRGTTDKGLVKDEYLNFTAGVNFGELWFLRPRDEDR